MADGFKFDIRVDRREMDAALKRLYLFSKHAPARLVNQAAFRSNQKAVWYAPAVSRLQLQTEVGPVGQKIIGQKVRILKGRLNKKTGERIGAGVRAGRFIGGDMIFAPGRTKDKRGNPVALLLLIIQKRTGGALTRGLSAVEGGRALYDEMLRIYGARQKSRAYFKAAFATIRDAFKRAAGGKIPFSDEKSRGSGTVTSLRRDLGRLANVTPARDSQGNKARATFEIISPRHDIKGAIYKHAAPALQRGMDEEAAYLLKKSFELELRNFCKSAGIRTN